MSDSIRILLHGARGRMGAALCATLAEFPAAVVVASVDRHGAGVLPGAAALTAAELDKAPAFDVAIDFSAPEGFDAVLALCRERDAGLVSGTTGLSQAQFTRLSEAAQQLPVIWASNYSVGMAALKRAAALLAAQVDWDCEIVEAHHRHKRDAPSGSALGLMQAVADARGGATGFVDRIAANGEPRTAGSIGIASVRGGSVVGDHTVHFLTAGERLELTHRADDRAIFARGAWQAALRLSGRPAGRYQLDELLWS